MQARQDACNDVNDCLVEYKNSEKLLYKKENAIVLENEGHMSDNIEFGKSKNLETLK
jgi:hypothetical protein